MRVRHERSSPQEEETPRDVIEFEREQLRFFLTRDDLASTLAEINPSIAWLPWLAEMKLLQPGTQLAPWIEKNFAELDGVRDVAANIHYFDSETAELLQYALQQTVGQFIAGPDQMLAINHSAYAQRKAQRIG